MDIVDPQSVPDFKISPEEEKRICEVVKQDEEKEYIEELEKHHTKVVRVVNEDEFIVEAFPQEQALVVKKLDEYFDEASDLYIKMVEIRNTIDNVQKDPFSKWFFINATKYKEGDRLKFLYEQIKQLRRLKIVYEKKQIATLFKFVKFDTKEERKKYNTDTMMAREALLFDMLEYDGIKLKGRGNRLMGLCPFHEEKTPSFAAYVDNWYHCFGCQAHGNIFNYVMAKHNLDFKQALEEVDKFL